MAVRLILGWCQAKLGDADNSAKFEVAHTAASKTAEQLVEMLSLHGSSLASRPYISPFHSGLEEQFMQAVDASQKGLRHVIYDIGANDGDWSGHWKNEWSGWAHSLVAQGTLLQINMVEPQPDLGWKLRRLVDTLKTHGLDAAFLPFAAARRNGTQKLRRDRRGSVHASLVSAGETADRAAAVRTFDLAEFLLRTMPEAGSGGLSLLKLDLESLEFSLVPWLLTHGALCRASHIILEWHLHRLSVDKRLGGLGLRLGFHSLLEHGCEKPPMVFHDDFMDNNWGVPVPGLQDVLAQHRRWAPKGTPGGVRPSAGQVVTYTRDAEALGQSANAVALCQGPRRCFGSCRFEDLACNRRALRKSYASIMAAPAAARYLDDETWIIEPDKGTNLTSPARRCQCEAKNLQNAVQAVCCKLQQGV